MEARQFHVRLEYGVLDSARDFLVNASNPTEAIRKAIKESKVRSWRIRSAHVTRSDFTVVK